MSWRKARLAATVIPLVVTACDAGDKDARSQQTARAPDTTASSITRNRAEVLAPAAVSAVAPGTISTLSIIEALARPDFYDGHRVSIAGFLGSDESKLYLTREHAEHKLTRYAIALNRADCHEHFRPYPVALDDLKGDYVKIEGVLSTRMGGEFDESPAGLCNIDKIEAVRAEEP